MDDFFAWAWARHHNILSWYIRPLFLIPYCAFAYRRSVLGIALTIVALATSMFWFSVPEHVDARATEFLAMERAYLLGAWPWWKIALTMIVPLFFVTLALAFWRRSIALGVVIINAAGIGKIIWSLAFGKESGLSLVAPALLGLAIVNTAIWLWWRRRQC